MAEVDGRIKSTVQLKNPIVTQKDAVGYYKRIFEIEYRILYFLKKSQKVRIWLTFIDYEMDQGIKRFFDIGCNIGDYTFAALQRKCPEIIAVDANKEVITEFNSRFDLDNVQGMYYKTITPICAAVYSKSNSKVNLIKTTIPAINSIQGLEWQNGRFRDYYNNQANEVVPVKTVTIDDLIEKYGEPSFIKLDIEGSELEAIKGYTRVCDCTITFEWVSEMRQQAIKIIRLLQQKGYDLFGCYSGQDIPFQRPENMGDSEFCIRQMDLAIKAYKEGEKPCGMIWAINNKQ